MASARVSRGEVAGGAAAIQWGVCAGVGVGVQGEAAVVPAARGVYAVTCPAGSGVVWERLVLVGRSTSAAVAPAVVTAEKVVADAEVQQLPLQQSQQREQGQQRVAPWMTCVHSSGQPQHVVGGRGVCVGAAGCAAGRGQGEGHIRGQLPAEKHCRMAVNKGLVAAAEGRSCVV